VAFDVYAMLWLVPIEGGPAKRLTDEIFEIAQPDWSPDGKTLAFQSYRDGNFHVWTIGADGTGLKQLTKGAFDCREPRWSPDGRKIAFSSDRGGRYGVHLLDVASGEITAFSSGRPTSSNPPGRRTARASPSRSTRSASTSRAWTARGGRWPRSRPRPTASTPPRWPARPSRRTVRTWSSPPSRTARPSCAAPPAIVVQGEDVFPFRPSWLPSGEFLYTADGQIKRRAPGGEAKTVAFTAAVPVLTPRYTKKSRDFLSAKTRPVVGIGSPALSPDGRQVAFRALNDLYLLDIGGGPAKP
jgi:dipeptidyl aminopeptidase/acylaminoacyl peptidase